MPSTTHVLDEARDLVMKRLAELDDERKRLERALAELGGKGDRPGRPSHRPRSRPSARLGQESRRRPARRRGAAQGTRADQAVNLVEGSPGISASDIAKR